MTTLTRPRLPITARRNRWSVLSWVFMRASGVLLLFLALGHFAIMHVFNGVHNLSLGFVQARWALLGWRVYDALLLALALVHGLNGLRIVVNDYVLPPVLNKAVKLLMLAVGIVLIVVGTITIIGGVGIPS
jgi:succinate dehydrogenase / fumarate reductase membrane anchor subunit